MNVPASNKFLYFNEAADFATANNMSCYRADKIKGFRNVDATSLVIEFEPLLSVADSDDTSVVGDSVDLTIASATHKTVIESILNEITFGNSVNIVVFDAVASDSINSNISAATVTVTAEA